MRAPGSGDLQPGAAAQFDVSTRLFSVGIGMLGPTLMRFGTPEQQRRFLPPLRGEEIWCQLFSEAEAGSDLASLRTASVADGDHFVVNGQKVWSSDAQHPDWGILLARTDRRRRSTRGSAYLLDMHARHRGPPAAPGDGPRALQRGLLHRRAGAGGNIVGALHGGWAPVIATLTERKRGVRSASWVSRSHFDRFADLSRRLGVRDDPLVRQGLAGVHRASRCCGTCSCGCTPPWRRADRLGRRRRSPSSPSRPTSPRPPTR